ncbi:MAG: Ig-like domain-containing protein [Thermoanaerobaculia bacterium]
MRAIAFAAMLLSSLTLFAQAPSEVLYRDDFQSHGTQQNLPGWVDTAIGNPGPVADGLYKTWPDPTQGNKAPNVVYGTKSASGKPEGRNPRIGTFSTLTTKEFDAKGRFEFSGRLIRTRDDGRIGVTFLSQYPNADKYYLLGLWSQPTSSKLTMQLFAFDKALEDPVNPLGDQSARLKGIRDTGVTLDVNTWYRFFIRVDDSDGKTEIAARVWKDGSSEPTSFQIEVEDDVAQRLTKGRIGLWTAVKGDSYIDEILAKSPIDHSGPTIQFFRRTTAGNVELATGFETNADITPIIVATDDTDPNPTLTATLDGAPFTSGTTVTTEGTHVIVVRATDSLGNQSDGSVSFYIDKTAPIVVVFEGTDPLSVVAEGHVFDRDVSLNLQIDDLSSATVVATLDGQSFVPGTALAPAPLYGVEKHPHELVATIRDRVGNETAVGPLHFTVDKTAPEVTITRDGAPFSGGGFNTAIALAATVKDLTPAPLTMTLNGQPYAPGTSIAVNRQHTITASATDLAGHTTTQSITFVINQNAPGVRILENGEALPEGKYFKRPVNPKIEIDNSIPPSVQVTLDGSPWPVTLESVTGNIYLYSNGPIATDGTHTIAVLASDAAGNATPASVTFTIDQVAPSLIILESGTPLTDGAILGRDAIVTTDATDAIGPVTTTIRVDDQPFTSGNAITGSGVYTVNATASDKAGNETSAGPLRLTIDKNAPEVSLLEGGEAFPVDHWFNRDVVPSISVTDLTAVTVVVTIDGATATFTRSSVDGTSSIWSGPAVTTENEHTIGVTVTDKVGLVTTLAPLHFWIDKTAPTITLATPAPSSVVVAAIADLSGAADDAVSVTVGGRPATIDAATKRWSLTAVSLLEGSNTLAITGTDRAGNASNVTPSLILDTRGPALQVLSPANGSCTNASDLVIQGTSSDARLASVAVALDGQAPVAAQLELGAGTWSVSLPGIAQGIHQITVTSADSAGHTSNAMLTVRVDRIQPVIEVTEGGASFALTRVNRAVSLFVRAVDADPSVALTLTLDSGSFVSGSVIAGEGNHTLVVSARDCAGNEEQKTVSFSIDLTAPVFTALSPGNGGTVGTMPSSVAGTVSSDATTVKLLAAGSPPIEAVVSNGSFTLSGVPFEEGTNRFTLHAADDAGNESSVDYTVAVRTALPVVEITENGTPIAPNALFNRDVTPTITSSDPDATVVATLDGASYSIGSAITTDDSHTLSASATDDLGHLGTKSVTFTIDKTAPAVVITAPAAGASIASDTVTVTGTAGDAASVTVNGVSATLSSGAFSATVALELGENVIVAVARDEAGNSGRAEVTVTRAGVGPAIVLLYPTDKSLTNRPQSEVRGRVITPANVQSVTIALGGQAKATLTPDAAGDFRATLELTEGLNAISASSLGKDGKSATASVQVTADFTPPALKLLANAAELRDGARFAERAALSVELSDAQSPAPTLELTIDGNASTAPKTIDERGGHVVLATARDAAGNETRVERSFTIGSGTGTTSDCRVSQLDPKAGSIIASNVTRIAGRTSAPGVKVGGIAAEVVDGSFCVSVELANEGLNTIEIVCTDASGNPLGDEVTHTLERVTGAPTVTITTPTEGQSLGKNATGTISVSGTVGSGVVAVTVNGVRKPLDTNIDTQRSFTVDGVRVATGLNIIAARAETSSMRTATATRRVVYFGDAAAIAITSPVGTVVTGASSIDVSGTWSNLDPTSLTPAVSTNEYNDTSGRFLLANVPLNIGSNRITVSGVDAAGLPVSAFVDVTRTAGVPSVSISEPADNTYVASDEVIVRGTAEAAVGSTVQVNGLATNAMSEPAGEGRVRITFDASVHVSDSGAITPIVARVSEPGGGGSFDTIRVTRFAGAFAIRKDDENTTLVFPAMSAVQVSTTIQTLVAFTHAVDRASVVAGGVTLVAANGQAVSGVLRVDRDVVSFAPSTPLAEGESYTIKVASTVKDLAGTALGAPYESRFVTAITAPQTAPQVTTPPASVCGTTLGIDGTAVPNARVQLDSGSWQFTATASATGAFHFDLPLTGQSGYQLVRVRTVGTDGSLSPASDVCVRVDCGGTRVLGATYDTTANAISIVFSDAIDGSTLGVGGSIRLTSAAGIAIGGSVTLSTPVTAIVTPERNLADETFTLTVTTSVKDASGNALTAPFSQTFFAGGGAAQGNPGDGYLTGEVYDAKTGRPLAGATVTLGAAASQAPVPPVSLLAVTDARGRYTIFVPEGAHTIEVSAPGYTTVWRQIVVPAGAGVVPIDVRLEERGEPKVVASGDLTLNAGGAPEVTTPVSLTVTSGSVNAGSSVTLTSVNAQSLAGLLPLGWSPLASAEVVVSGGANGRVAESGNRVSTRGARSVIPSAARDLQNGLTNASAAAVALSATLKFTVDASAITAAAQSLTGVRYDAARDEWTVVSAAVSLEGNTATVAITSDGAYALVYADKGPGLVTPSLPAAGVALQGVTDPCLAAGACDQLTEKSFTLNPRVVMPNQRTTAILEADSALGPELAALPPSGTAVQAYIDEELTLSDGSTITDPPFATDLILYRDLDGAPAAATFHLAPSKRATEVFLNVGYEHIRIHPYPGRLDRGTLIGSEGGRVPGDGSVTVDIPAGATPEPVRAEVHPIADLIPFGTIQGFTVVSAFEFELSRATQPAESDLDGDGQPDAAAPVELLKSANATFALQTAETRQLILAEILGDTSYGTIVQLASVCFVPTAEKRTTTIGREGLPLDGIIREGRYLLLAANQQIAYATGLVRLGSATGPVVGGGRVRSQSQAIGAQPLGVADVTRVTGIYSVPVPAEAYQLRAEHPSTGEGAPHAAAAPAAGSVEYVTLVLAPQPAAVTAVRVFKANLAVVDLTKTSGTEIAVTSDIMVDVSKSLDPTSVSNDSIIVATTSGARVPGVVSLNGPSLTWTTAIANSEKLRLAPNTRYVVTVSATIRASNGTPMGETRTYGFATVEQFLGGGIRRDKIRITIPTPDGVSTITGEGSADPNERAVPSNAVVVAVRRSRAFITQYQAQADITGAFRFDIGTDGGTDKVSIRDVIDLHVVNSAGILMGVVRLGPFADPNGLGFVPPVGEAASFTTVENVTITVPAGAFTEPAIVTAKVANDTAFRTVADVASELSFGTGLTVNLQCGDARTPCEAKIPLELELPVPAGTDTARAWYLGAVGASAMGPRVMLVDTLRIDGGKFKTAAQAAGAKTSSSTLNAATGGWLDFGAKGCLLRTTRSSEYVGVSLTMGGGSLSLGAAFFSSADTALELTNSQFKSLYLADYYFGSGRDCAAFPVVQGQAFTMTGIDRRTGLVASERVYDAIPVGSGPYPAGSPEENETGPYPIWTSPGRIEVVTLQVVDVEDESVRGLKVELNSKEIATVSRTTLAAGLRIGILNVNRGVYQSVRSETLPVTLAAKLGDLLVIAIEQQEVDPFSDISIVFNEPIAMDGEPRDVLPNLITVEVADGASASPAFTDITDTIVFDMDSIGRRIILSAPGSLPRGALVRLTLSKDIADSSDPALKLGQYKDGASAAGGGSDQYLWFRVRAPKGELSHFDIPAGAIRMLALFGNTLFVAAMDSGTLAYDVANPSALLGAEAPYAQACGSSQDWAVKTDHHGRIFTTGINSGTFGFLRSYRIEDFLAKKGTPSTGCDDTSRVLARAGTTISWAPGATSGTLGLTAESDRAEAVPRRFEVLHQDIDEPSLRREEFLSAYTVSNLTTQGEAKRFDVSIPWYGTPYALQRVTIENVTSKMRWSGDAKAGVPATITGVVAGPFDTLRVVRNRSTWAVVSLFGFGVGVYDLNAIESNDSGAATKSEEQIALLKVHSGQCTAGIRWRNDYDFTQEDPAVIHDVRFSPEIAIRSSENKLFLYAIDRVKGVLDLHTTSAISSTIFDCDLATGTRDARYSRAPEGLVLAHRESAGLVLDNPRLATLKAIYPGGAPQLNFVGSVVYAANEATYNLVAARGYGLLVIETGNEAEEPWRIHEDLASIIWIPAGAYGVRLVPGAAMASVVDCEGRLQLVDLTGIDERALVSTPDELFPSTKAALLGRGAYGVGAPDSRILWSSEPGLFTGTVPPVIDPTTGIAYGGELLAKTTHVVSAIDKPLQAEIIGDTSGEPKPAGAIVPLGERLPRSYACGGAAAASEACRNASLGAFRLTMELPGGVADDLPGDEFRIIVASDFASAIGTRAAGSLPASTITVPMRRAVPAALAAELRNQEGYNRFVSPWIVAIADPRARPGYPWTADADKEKVGCFQGGRPAHLKDKGEAEGVYELATPGRFITVRLDPAVGSGLTLLDPAKFTMRIPVIHAETARPPKEREAAQDAPVATGMLEGRYLLHSGELAVSATDLDAGGRAGWNVVFGRTYRSRTIGGTVFGQGWDSPILRRLRVLATGDVELRDGTGEIWLFVQSGSAGYQSPAGLFLKLVRTDRGWNLIDQKWRVTSFDEYGRLASESDEFFDVTKPGSGNVIRSLYDDSGRLVRIVDPVGRVSTITYWADGEEGTAGAFSGYVKEITDWRNRKTRYEFNPKGQLIRVRLPQVTGVSESVITYEYAPTSAAYGDVLELGNLVKITDPGETTPRVTFDYEVTGVNRDRVKRETWATGETATITYNSETSVSVTDVLGQKREYTLTARNDDELADRVHIATLVEKQVPTSTTPIGELPAALSAAAPPVSPQDRTYNIAYRREGMLDSATVQGVRSIANGWQPLLNGAGFIRKSVTATPLALPSAKTLPVSKTSQTTSTSLGPITREFVYQSGPNSGSFIASIRANGKAIAVPEAHRHNTAPESANSGVTSTETYDVTGQLKEVATTGGTDPQATAGSQRKIEYFDASAPAQKRGRPKRITIPASPQDLVTTLDYPTEDREVKIDPYGVTTTADFDAWRRAVRVRIERPGDPLVVDQQFFYGATGRLDRIVEKKGTSDITTSYKYDVMGRRTETKRNGVAVEGGEIVATTSYDLPNRRIVTTKPGGAVTTIELDSLGRAMRTHLETGPGSSDIETRLGYDLDDNIVFESDGLTASATAFDAHGRAIATKYADGTVTTTEFDEWARAKSIEDLSADPAPQVVGGSSYEFTDAGTLKNQSTKIDATTERRTDFAWDGGGRTTSTATAGRVTKSTFDPADRLVDYAVGAGSVAGLTDISTRTQATAHVGMLPLQTTTTERSGSALTTQTEYNTTGDPVVNRLGGLEWRETFDQLGSRSESQPPGQPATRYDTDSRGAVTKETLPDGSENEFTHDATGAETRYEDAVNEPTSTQRDWIGRPLVRAYADGTTERVEWEASRIKSVTDRQGRKQAFTYNTKGQLTEIRDGADGVLDRLTYDSAGRVVSWLNRDSEVTWSDFDLDGNPKTTSQKRFKDGTGLTSPPVVLDEYVQHHRWNEQGERTHWSMPAYAGLAFGPGWATWIVEQYDAVGNLTVVGKAGDPADPAGVALMTASYRNAGRPDVRTVFAGASSSTPGVPVVRTYGYHPTTSLMNKLAVTVNGVVIAGSEVTHDGLHKSDAKLLGISGGERYTRWRHDTRGRLAASLFGASDLNADPSMPIPGRASEQLTPADFRTAQGRLQQLSGATAPGDPPTKTITERVGGGHKIDRVTRGPKVYPFGYSGAEVVNDGRFTYEFDAKGRLIRATENTATTPARRVVFSYSGTGRLVGRRAEYTTVANPQSGDWRLEDRASVIRADGEAAEVTFVWDPISDRLITVAKAGAIASDPHGGILKQVIHGGMSYDDPIETATVDPLAPNTVNYLYPIYDEAGAGSLQAVVNKMGEIVARNLSNDPFGGEELDLAGAAIDRVAVRATKNSDGTLASVSVEIRSTEAIAPASMPAGVRLAAIDTNGAVIRVSGVAPSLADANTARWTLTGSEYAELTSGAAAISIAATNALRASAWGADVPVLPVPAWAVSTTPVYSSAQLPVEVRESLASLTSFLNGVPGGEERTSSLYEVEGLALLGATGSDTPLDDILSARLHAHPYTEPFTGLNYVRERWYQPLSGSWLSPDPKGYVDSSNLYSFAGSNPVDRRDPTGTDDYWIERSDEILAELRQLGEFDFSRRAELKQELKELVETRPVVDPNAPKEPGVIDKIISAGKRWIGLGDEVEGNYKQALRESYPKKKRDVPQDVAEEMAGVYGTEDRGAKLQEATFEDVGGKAVNVGTQLAQGGAEGVVLKGGSALVRVARLSSGIKRLSKTRLIFEGFEVRAARDLSHLSESTLREMRAKGFAGKTVDGIPIQVHHMGQNPAGPFVEIPITFHKSGNRRQHPLGNLKGVGLTPQQREEFDQWRERYWKARADEELLRKGLL